jgi:hypothetical protein
MRLSFSYHWSFSAMRVAVAVSEQPVPRPATTTIVELAPMAPAALVPGPTALSPAPAYAPVAVRP